MINSIFVFVYFVCAMADFELHLDPRTGEPMDLRGPSELNEALARIKTNTRTHQDKC
jgi:hypothetical protein